MRYRKKPVEIEAIQLTAQSIDECVRFLGIGGTVGASESQIAIQTLEGTMIASFGDWIIRGVKGEFYPCKPDIFEATYEPVNESANADGEEEGPACENCGKRPAPCRSLDEIPLCVECATALEKSESKKSLGKMRLVHRPETPE